MEEFGAKLVSKSSVSRAKSAAVQSARSEQRKKLSTYESVLSQPKGHGTIKYIATVQPPRVLQAKYINGEYRPPNPVINNGPRPRMSHEELEKIKALRAKNKEKILAKK